MNNIVLIHHIQFPPSLNQKRDWSVFVASWWFWFMIGEKARFINSVNICSTRNDLENKTHLSRMNQLQILLFLVFPWVRIPLIAERLTKCHNSFTKLIYFFYSLIGFGCWTRLIRMATVLKTGKLMNQKKLHRIWLMSKRQKWI